MRPPEGWRERDDAGDLARAVTRLAYAEAEVWRAVDRLRADAPLDDHWEALYDWEDNAYKLLAALGAARETRDHCARDVEVILTRWHDEDRKVDD